jgi:Flagellar hook-length control protein FliK
MNAAQISVNAAAGNAGSGANPQAAKASTLPAFAQVMAEKQAAASAPKEMAPANGTEKANAANRAADAATQKSSNPTPGNEKGQTGGAGDLAKKSDAKGKSPNDARSGKSAAQTATQVPAQAVTQIPVMLPGLKGAGPWLAPEGMGNTAPNNMDPAKSVPAAGTAAVPAAAGTAPMNVAQAVGQTVAATAGETQMQGPVASELPNANAGGLQEPQTSAANAPGVPAKATADVRSEPTQAPATATTLPATTEIPSTVNAANLASAAVAGQSLPAAGNDLNARPAAVNLTSAPGSQAAPTGNEAKPMESSTAVATATLAAATGSSLATNPQASPKVQAKRGVQEILPGGAGIAGKEAQPAAQASVSAMKDFADAIKRNSGAGDSTAPNGSQPVVSAKNEMPVSVKAEPVVPEAAQPADKPGSAKSGSTSKGNSSGDANSSGNSSGSSAAGPGNGKDSSVIVDPNAAHNVMPAGQSDPVNLTTGAANAVPAPGPTTGRDSGSAVAAKAGDASNNGAPAVADADDMAAQPNESRVVNVAQLTGSESHSQVRIAMQADQLGQVELHATVHGQLVGAAITVEKKEAHAAMAAEMPSLQQALEQRQLRVGEVVFMQGAMHSTAGDTGNAATEQQRRGQAGTTYQQVENATMHETGGGTSLEASGIFDDSGRLSVRA